MMNALIIAGCSFFSPHSFDSLGVQEIDGMVFVIHKVDEKETLYGISKRYGTTIEAILKYNPTADAGLEIGLILKVPYTKGKTTKTGNNTIHTVAGKETLYSISRVYDVSIDDIKKWNNLTTNELSVGQELVIKKTATLANTSPVTNPNLKPGTHQVAAKETLYSISKQYDVSIEEIRRWNDLNGSELKIGQIIIVAPSGGPAIKPVPEESVVKSQPKNTDEIKPVEVVTPEVVKAPQPETTTTRHVTISESVKDGDEVVQAGLAELIEGTEANRKYLALHRTAPKGTILKVRNEMNNREVFVRVMGKLPDTAVNDKLIIKISKSAFDRLGAIDKKFRVEVTYYE